jgi:thymidylate synthase ThyX
MALIDSQLERIRHTGFKIASKKYPFLDGHYLYASPLELLAWSSVRGLASLFVDGPVAKGKRREDKIHIADAMLRGLAPAFGR